MSSSLAEKPKFFSSAHGAPKAGGHGQGGHPVTPQGPTRPELRRSAFVLNTALEARASRPAKRYEGGALSENFTLSEKTRGDYQGLLEDHVRRLMRYQDRHAADLQDPALELDRQILESITHGKHLSDEALKTAVSSYLDAQANYVPVTLLMQDLATKALSSVDKVAVIEPAAGKGAKAKSTTSYLAKPSFGGRIADALSVDPRDHVNKKSLLRAGALAVVAGAGAGGFAGAGGKGALIGTVGAVGAGIAARALMGADRGMTLSYEKGKAGEAWAAVTSDPKQLRYMEAMTDVGQVSPEVTQAWAERVLRSTLRFQVEAGVEMNQLEPPEQWLLRSGTVGERPNANTTWDADVYGELQKRFKSRTGTDFTPGSTVLDADLVKDWYAARRTVAVRKIKEQAGIAAERDSSWDRDSQIIGNKITALKKGEGEGGKEGELLEARRKPLREKEKVIQSQIDVLDEDKKTYGAFHMEESQLTSLQEDFHIKYPTFPNADAAIAHYEAIVSGPASTAGTLREIGARVNKARAAARKSIVASYPVSSFTSARDPGAYYQTIDAAVETSVRNSGLLGELESVKTSTSQALEDLKRRKGEIEAKQRAVSGQEGQKKAEGLITTLGKEYQSVINIRGGGVISRDDLCDQTIEDLTEEMNIIHTATGGAEGWPEEENKDPEHVQRIVHAKIEANALRAQESALNPLSSDYDPKFAGWQTDHTLITGADLLVTETQLRTMSTGDLSGMIAHRIAIKGLGYTISPDQVQHAVDFAKQMFKFREQQTNTLAESFTAEKQGITHAIERINPETEVILLEETQKIMARVAGDEGLYSKLEEITAQNAEYQDDHTVAAKGGPFPVGEKLYTDAERDLGQAKGYYEWLNFFTDYQSQTNRQEAFTRASSLLSPQKLGDLLNAELELGVTPGGPVKDVLTSLGRKITDGDMGAVDLIPGLTGILNQIRAEAKAIT